MDKLSERTRLPGPWPDGKWLNVLRRRFNLRLNGHSLLAAQLLRRIFALYFSVALVVTAVQLSLQYGDELGRLQEEISAAVRLVEPALSKTMWDIDKPGTAAIAEGLSRNHSVAGLQLDGEQPIILGMTPMKSASAGGAQDWHGQLPSTLYEQRFPIRHPESDRPDKVVGTLKIYASAVTVMERAMNALLAVVVSAAVKTAALWLILYFTITSVIARPLTRLAHGLNRIHREHSADLPRRPFSTSSRPDEMTFLLRSFVAMHGALRRSKRRLLAHQADLEQKIADRTRELHDQAMRDELTGLLNRRAFERAMSDLMCKPAGMQMPNVLCLIDLDRFKLVNDTFGHAAGDQVLRQIAELLRRNTRPDDTIARIGGDEFAVILHDCSPGDAQAKMSRLEKDVASLVLEKDGRRVAVGMSAGLVAFTASTGDDLRHAMEQADAACYAAKEAGRQQIKVFGEGAGALRRKADINWVRVINEALSENRFALYAQAIHSSTDRSIRSIEVLLRLSMDGTLVGPATFLPAAQRYGFATKIDEWVLTQTLQHAARHPALWQHFNAIHINLSSTSIADPKFFRFAVRQLRQFRPPAGKICFEVTETAAIDRLDDAVRSMDGLRRRGVTFALDDFGHGTSSYTRLQTLPVNQIKIDGSFVRTMVDNPVSLAIVKSINDIAHMSGMTTVAEYVENDVIAAKLHELQIDYVQGFLFGEPLPIESILNPVRPKENEE